MLIPVCAPSNLTVYIFNIHHIGNHESGGRNILDVDNIVSIDLPYL